MRLSNNENILWDHSSLQKVMAYYFEIMTCCAEYLKNHAKRTLVIYPQRRPATANLKLTCKIQGQTQGTNIQTDHRKKAMSEQLTQKISNANLHLRFPQFSKGSIPLKKME